MLTDSHCHLNYINYETAIAAAKANGVTQMLSAGVTLEEAPHNLKIAKSYPNIYCSVGVHPTEKDCMEPTKETLIAAAENKKVVAIGETGLDYYRENNREKQIERFRIHIRAARELNKPIIIHARDAFSDIFTAINEENAQEVGGVFHCYTGDLTIAKKVLDLGFYIGISGIVTFKKAVQVQEVAKNIPIENLLLETDAPYLAPVPKRGEENEPAYLKYTAEYVAWLRNISLEELAKTTTNNFNKLFLKKVK